MRIITRYILREVTSHALLGGALFTFIIFTRDLGRILEFIVRDSATYSDVARIILYTLPNALVVTIPKAASTAKTAKNFREIVRRTCTTFLSTESTGRVSRSPRVQTTSCADLSADCANVEP